MATKKRKSTKRRTAARRKKAEQRLPAGLGTLFGGLLPTLVAGSLLVEYIFNIPGMGTLSLLALSSRDYPLQMALFAFTGMLTLGGIFLSDMLYLAADPRIKLHTK